MSKRRYKSGVDRQQGYLLPPAVDEYVASNNPVRAIDTYVESLDLAALKFTHTSETVTPGQPAYPPKGMLKLYLYGYLNRTRSSRRLEAECRRNLEVIWLVNGLTPSFKAIAAFRSNNLQALKAVNRDFVQLCKELELFGGELVGIDGSFFRGNVAKSSIFTAERLQHSLECVDADIERYMAEMVAADEAGEAGEVRTADPALAEKLTKLRARQAQRSAQLQALAESGATQIAEVDADARLLSKRGQSLAGYNVQTAVDAKHKLIVVGAVVQDGNDFHQLEPMAKAAKAELEVEELVAIEDSGYFNQQQILNCEASGITPYVPEPDKQALARKEKRFVRDAFSYEEDGNLYRCPAGRELHFSATQRKGEKVMLLYRSSEPVCAACPLKGQCLPKKTLHRSISRWEHEGDLSTHRQRMAQKGKEMMALRAQLCEHPFGTLKHWCGWQHFLLRGLEKVRAEFSLLMLAYNFKRVLSILGLTQFRAYCLLRRFRNPVLNLQG
jgi:transposase